MEKIKNRSAVLINIISCIVILMLIVYFSGLNVAKGTYGLSDGTSSEENTSTGVCYLCLGKEGSVVSDGYYVWSSDGSVPESKNCHKNIDNINSEVVCDDGAPSPNLYECTNPADSSKVCIKAYDSAWASASLGETGMSCKKVNKCTTCEYTSEKDCESKNDGYTCKEDEQTGCFVKDSLKCNPDDEAYTTKENCETNNSGYSCKKDEETGCFVKETCPDDTYQTEKECEKAHSGYNCITNDNIC